MLRQRTVATLSAGLFTTIIAGALIANGQPQQQTARESIPLSDLQTKDVIGQLGFRLGTAVEVSGVYASSGENRKPSRIPSKDPDKLMLRIESVNGRQIPQPVLYSHDSEISTVSDSPKEWKHLVGSRFHLAGFETGAFGGLPIDFEKFRQPAAGVEFRFRPGFTIIADLANPKDKNPSGIQK